MSGWLRNALKTSDAAAQQAAMLPAQDSASDAGNVAVLAAALAGLLLTPADPKLVHGERLSRTPSLRDLEEPWAAYWLGELGERPSPTRRAWTGAAFLQTLYELDLLRPGLRVAALSVDPKMEAYLASLRLILAGAETTPVDVILNGAAPCDADMSALRERLKPGGAALLLIAWTHTGQVRDLEQAAKAAGLAVWDAHLLRPEHPLDAYVAGPAPVVGEPDLARDVGGETERLFLLVAQRLV